MVKKTVFTIEKCTNHNEYLKLLFLECFSLRQIIIGNEKITEYPFKVSYEIMAYLQCIGITATEVVLTQTDFRRIVNYDESLTFTIPDEVKYIDDNCFRNETLLKEIILHHHLIEFGENCFENCKALINYKI